MENNNVLKRFRKKKEELIGFGTKLVDELDREIRRLQEELD